ncbi:MAG: hypothetical protein MK207_11005 [Saprospiraceae bacterium]|nr:hypothetical protein [Saprospiraceae bacterium]
MKKIIFYALIIPLIISCWDIQTGKPITGVAPGIWRGQFTIDGQAIPIMFEVLNTDNNKQIEVVFKTAEQQLKADSVRVWGDTMFIDFKKANTQLKVVCQIDQMDGFLYDKSGIEYPIVFAGHHAILHRFPDIRKTPKADLTGDWEITAYESQDSRITGRLRLVTQENKINGLLMIDSNEKITIEGCVQGTSIYLSGFNGKTVCLLKATIKNSKTLVSGTLITNKKSLFWEATSSAGVIK